MVRAKNFNEAFNGLFQDIWVCGLQKNNNPRKTFFDKFNLYLRWA